MDEAREPGIRFSGVAVDRIRFDDVPVGVMPPEELQFQVTLNRKSWESPPCVDVTIHLRISPAGGSHQFLVEISVTGRFEPISGDANMPLDEFAKINGPSLVMPFVRELVANITARSRKGMILLPPINVAALVKKEAASVGDV